MKRIIQYTTIIIALGLAVSCNQFEEVTSDGGLIRFAPKSVVTKAMVTSDNLTDQAFSVIDLMGTSTDPFIRDVITYSPPDEAWVYESGNTYYWENGSHKLFGYTHNGGNLDGTTLTISEKVLAWNSNQTDILYSNIISTTAADWKAGHVINEPVPLVFDHLFSAIRISMENYTGAALTVNSVTVTLPNKASATVTFGTTEDATKVVPAITGLTTSGNFGGFSGSSNAVLLDPEEIVDVLDGSKLEGDDATATPYMIWPQTLTEGAATITVKYTPTGGSAKSKSVSLPATFLDPETETEKSVVWEAGKINSYNLLLYPEELKLKFVVQDWDQANIPAINTATGSINMSNVTWMNSKVTVGGVETNTVVDEDYAVYMYYQPTVNGALYDGYFPAQGYFTVNYPQSGKYKLGLIPAYGATTVDEDMYEIWIYNGTTWSRHNQNAGEDISHDTVYFQVRAASGQDGVEHKAQINIWFKPNGSDEWISAYSEVRANYALTIPATS